jgi:hypothetical protein
LHHSATLLKFGITSATARAAVISGNPQAMVSLVLWINVLSKVNLSWAYRPRGGGVCADGGTRAPDIR